MHIHHLSMEVGWCKIGMLNRSICYGLYLHILRFYFVAVKYHISVDHNFIISHKSYLVVTTKLLFLIINAILLFPLMVFIISIILNSFVQKKPGKRNTKAITHYCTKSCYFITLMLSFCIVSSLTQGMYVAVRFRNRKKNIIYMAMVSSFSLHTNSDNFLTQYFYGIQTLLCYQIHVLSGHILIQIVCLGMY